VCLVPIRQIIAMKMVPTAMFVLLLASIFLGGSQAASVRDLKLLRQVAATSGFVKALEFKHRLRVCNAYPYAAALDVSRGRESLTKQAMPYKGCEDFEAPLKSGDKLEFKVGDTTAGTFSVADLPNNDAVLLLVIHRHDTVSTAVSFESHVYGNTQNAQVAVIDTYKGEARATPIISEEPKVSEKGEEKATTEELRYASVVALNAGKYEVALMGSDGEEKSRDELVALNQESYIVLRVGAEAKQGPVFPQELVVFPRSDPAALQSSALALSLLPSVIVAMLFVLFAARL